MRKRLWLPGALLAALTLPAGAATSPLAESDRTMGALLAMSIAAPQKLRYLAAS